VLQSAQDPQYRHYVYDPIVRSTAAMQCSEEARKAAAAEADDEAGDSRPILEQCVKQTAMVASMVAAFTDETEAIAESLQCAPPQACMLLCARSRKPPVTSWMEDYLAHHVPLRWQQCIVPLILPDCRLHPFSSSITPCRVLRDDLKWRHEQFAQLRDLMREMRRNPSFYYFQRQALWLGYTAEAAEDMETDEEARAVMHERVYRGLVTRTLQRCISQYVEGGETEERCTNAIAYAATPWGRIAREVYKEVGQLDGVSGSDADTYVPSQLSSAAESDYMSSYSSTSTPRISG
jgi:hypothetical protein